MMAGLKLEGETANVLGPEKALSGTVLTCGTMGIAAVHGLCAALHIIGPPFSKFKVGAKRFDYVTWRMVDTHKEWEAEDPWSRLKRKFREDVASIEVIVWRMFPETSVICGQPLMCCRFVGISYSDLQEWIAEKRNGDRTSISPLSPVT